MKEVFNNLKDSSNETREEVIKQLLKKMGKTELEEWIKNSDMSDEFKKQMLQDIHKLIGKKI
jgi:formate dehydrogenase maturation protein FdhE